MVSSAVTRATDLRRRYAPKRKLKARGASGQAGAPAAGARRILLWPALLMVLSVAVLALLAGRAIEHWTDQDLFLLWLALWAVIFSATALFDGWRSARPPKVDSEPLITAGRRRQEQALALRRLTEMERRRHGGYLPYL